MNKKINFSEPLINFKNFAKSSKKIFKKNYVSEGGCAKQLENKIKKIIKVKYATVVSSGSSALFLALKAINLEPKDEVILPNITFQATANAVSMAGGKVVLCDIDKKNLLIDPKDLIKKINSKTKAIIFVNISGRGENIFDIKKIANDKGLFLIEDASEALFSKFKNKYYGTFGDIGCFSFAPNKIITLGQGGLVVTNKKFFYKKINLFKNQGKSKTSFLFSDSYDHEGFNFRSSDINCALGLSQLANINKRISKLRKNYMYYKKNLLENKNFKVIDFNISEGELPLWTEVFSDKKQILMKYLKSKGIFCRSLWLPISRTKPFKKKINLFKNTQDIQNKVFWLPSSLNMKEKDQRKICKMINEKIKKNL